MSLTLGDSIMTDDHRIMVDLADEAFWWQNTDPYRAHLYKRAYRHIEGLQAMIDELDPDRLREDRDELDDLEEEEEDYDQ